MKTRKAILTAILLAGFFLTSFAQEGEKEMQFLFNAESHNISISGFGGPIVGFTQIGDEFAVTTGGGGAALFNQKFYVGGYGEGLLTRHTKDIEMYDRSIGENRYYYKMYTRFGHGGFWLGYIHNPHNAIHWGISTKAGFGAITLSEETFSHHDNRNDLEYDNVFVFNPQLELEMNLTHWFRINFGIGYQLVTGVNKEYEVQEGSEIVLKKYFDQQDFNKPVGHITFCFGWFNN